MRVVVLANDVVPGMGVPVAAPGLRAWGLALGLRAHGHEVTVVVDQWMVGQVWRGRIPAPLPPSTLIMHPRLLPGFVRAHRIDVVVMSNSNHIDALEQLDCRLVYDFFAPKMLELQENVNRPDLEVAMRRLGDRKRRSLSRSDAVVVNGAKKLPYVRDWLERSDAASRPVEVVYPALPPRDPQPRDDGLLHVIVGGYLQPWSRPGAWSSALLPLLEEGGLRLHLLLERHWGQTATTEQTPPELERLAEHPAVHRHGLLRFGDFRALLSRCHLSIDVFARNPERELAMITRSAVALASGVPVLHVPFTEISPWIETHGAGWLVDEDDSDAMEHVVRTAMREGTDEARAGAVRVAHDVLEPSVATRPLHDLLLRLE